MNNFDLGLDWYKEGDYLATNSSGVEREVGEFLYGMVRILKPKRILESGTAKGISSAYMGMALKDNGFGWLRTYEFDGQHWDDAKQLWERLGIDNFISLFKMKVFDTLNWNGEEFDMLFLDSEPDQRWNELEKLYLMLKPGGYVFLHDLPRGFCKGNVNPDHPEIKDWPWGPVPQQVQYWLEDGDLKEFHLPNPREMCGFYKRRSDDYRP